ncbi:uncharacterized protein [Cardiocondyla obscurior]|uniref:uncharacterized protein n=1 Tax=Cardiocondyla obscurior TaxID=286306 RepID=UPI0039656AE7
MGLVEREAEMQELNAPRPGRSRDLFGVQLEVTSLLLEGERRKLAVLQRELQAALEEGGSVKVKEKQRQELLHAISKIQGQHEQLDKEYRIHAAGVLLCNSRGSGKISWIGCKVRAKICGNWIDMQTLLLVTTGTLMKRFFHEVDKIGTFSFSLSS